MGGLAFAATVMMIIGFFQIIASLVEIIDDEFYVVKRNYTFDLRRERLGMDTPARRPARVPYYPFWSLLVIALDIWVIWSLARPGVVRT